MKKVYIYNGFNRFWHWSQASLIIFLAISGFEIHGSLHLFGFEKAVEYHSTAAIALLILIAFAMFWHATTGAWKQYIPTTEKLFEQIMYYSKGMFKGEDHPTHKTELTKLNPLQRIVYVGFKLVLIPVTIFSGVLYMMHKTFDKNDIVVASDIKLEQLAGWHTVGAFLLMVFLVIHVYMTTTGSTPTANIKAMLTGYEELEEVNKDTKKEA